MVWTHFLDMQSGGTQKEKWGDIYIEAPIKEASLVFYNRFGHSPYRVTCTCCGEDYSLNESKNLEQATGFSRGCAFVYKNAKGQEVERNDAYGYGFGKGLKRGFSGCYVERVDEKRGRPYLSLRDYVKSKGVKIIKRKDIKKSETVGELPTQGYIWYD